MGIIKKWAHWKDKINRIVIPEALVWQLAAHLNPPIISPISGGLNHWTQAIHDCQNAIQAQKPNRKPLPAIRIHQRIQITPLPNISNQRQLAQNANPSPPQPQSPKQQGKPPLWAQLAFQMEKYRGKAIHSEEHSIDESFQMILL